MFRYSKIVRNCITRVRPPYYELREQIVRADFEKNMKLKNYKAISDMMRLKLASIAAASAAAGGIATSQSQREQPLLEYFLCRAL